MIGYSLFGWKLKFENNKKIIFNYFLHSHDSVMSYEQCARGVGQKNSIAGVGQKQKKWQRVRR